MKLLADGAGHTFGSDMMKARKETHPIALWHEPP
jgi:hypothetical protein